MKRFFVLISLLISTFASIAQDEWIFVQESKDGKTRLLTKKDSFGVQTTPKGEYFVFGLFATTSEGTLNPPLGVGTLVSSCAAKSGIVVIAADNNTIEKQYWTFGGPRFYDTAASLLCLWLSEEIKKKKESDAREPAPIPKSTVPGLRT